MGLLSSIQMNVSVQAVLVLVLGLVLGLVLEKALLRDLSNCRESHSQEGGSVLQGGTFWLDCSRYLGVWVVVVAAEVSVLGEGPDFEEGNDGGEKRKEEDQKRDCDGVLDDQR